LEEIKFLGHVISKEGVSVDPTKVEAVLQWESPKSVTEIHSFLGLTRYYRRFIEGYSKIAIYIYIYIYIYIHECLYIYMYECLFVIRVEQLFLSFQLIYSKHKNVPKNKWDK